MLRKIRRTIVQKIRQRNLSTVGKNVIIEEKCKFIGNVFLEDNILISCGAYFVSTNANLIIKSNNLFGPNVTIYTGDHATNIIGKHIIDITDEEKNKHGMYDKDVVIDEGCWIGTRAIILKGVHLGEGTVVAAGSVVTKSTPPFSIVGGVPARIIKMRFSENDIKLHKRIIKAKE